MNHLLESKFKIASCKMTEVELKYKLESNPTSVITCTKLTKDI